MSGHISTATRSACRSALIVRDSRRLYVRCKEPPRRRRRCRAAEISVPFMRRLAGEPSPATRLTAGHHLMPRPVAITTKGPCSLARVFHERAPAPETAADEIGIEAERVTDSDEREGPVGTVRREPVVHLREETLRPLALDAGALLEGLHRVREDRELQALFGMSPGPPEEA